VVVWVVWGGAVVGGGGGGGSGGQEGPKLERGASRMGARRGMGNTATKDTIKHGRVGKSWKERIRGWGLKRFELGV